MAGFLERLRAGLGRTAEAFSNLLARPLDTGAAEALRERLIAADFGPATAQEAVAAAQEAWKSDSALRGAGPAEAVAAAIERALGPASADLPRPAEGPLVVMLLGVNGAGKTTTAAKLAARWAREGRSCLLGACDTFRAAAGDQLAAWAARVGAETVGGAPGADPAAVAYDAVSAARARGRDVALLDTAGRLHTKSHLLEELRKVARVAGKALPGAPHERWLVLDGSLGSNSIEQARVFHEAVGLTGLVVTKLDGTARGGALVAATRELRVPVRFIGVGEGPDDLQPFDPRAYARATVGLDP
ncbi:MAG: signal recognition particle-docking protein FtsY [Opitutales bacterium]